MTDHGQKWMSEEEVGNKANSLPVICVGTSEARCGFYAFSNSRIVLYWYFFSVISVCSTGLSSFLSRSSVLRAGGSWRERSPPACGCAGGRLRAAPWWVRAVLQLSGRGRLGLEGSSSCSVSSRAWASATCRCAFLCCFACKDFTLGFSSRK